MNNKVLEFAVIEECELLKFLYKNINKSKNNIKSLLKNKCIYVNEKCVTKYNYILNKNDLVKIKLYNTNIDILYEDDELIIVNKESGKLCVSTDKEKEKTLFKEVSSYVKKKNKNNKVFIVNRIDKDTSGIVVFAKNKNIKELLQSKWNDIVLERGYIAIVDGFTDKEGIIKSYLCENKEHIVYSSKKGKLAITRYERIKYNNNYSMLKINLYTGRKNQIRVHMKDIHHPVLGDEKYGNKKSAERLMLHSELIEFINPLNNKKVRVKSPYPKEFDNMLKRM